MPVTRDADWTADSGRWLVRLRPPFRTPTDGRSRRLSPDPNDVVRPEALGVSAVARATYGMPTATHRALVWQETLTQHLWGQVLPCHGEPLGRHTVGWISTRPSDEGASMTVGLLYGVGICTDDLPQGEIECHHSLVLASGAGRLPTRQVERAMVSSPDSR